VRPSKEEDEDCERARKARVSLEEAFGGPSEESRSGSDRASERDADARMKPATATQNPPLALYPPASR